MKEMFRLLAAATCVFALAACFSGCAGSPEEGYDENASLDAIEYSSSGGEWLVSHVEADGFELRSTDPDKNGFITVQQRDATSAEEAANEYAGNFGAPLEVVDDTVAGIEWKRIDVLNGQVVLFADAPGGGVVMVASMYVDEADVGDVLENITLN